MKIGVKDPKITVNLIPLPNNTLLVSRESSKIQLEQEVNKMYKIRIINYIISLLAAFLSLNQIVYYFLKIFLLALSINLSIRYDKYHPEHKDILLSYIYKLNIKVKNKLPFIIINTFFTTRIIFGSSIRYSYFGNLDLDSKIKKFFCYCCCCCCQIGCIRIFLKIYFMLNCIYFGYSFYLCYQFNNYFNIDKDLNTLLKVMIGNQKIFLIIIFVEIALYGVLIYCINFIYYFLNRTELYLEYYKILVEENKMELADKVRFLLGHISKIKEFGNNTVMELREI